MKLFFATFFVVLIHIPKEQLAYISSERPPKPRPCQTQFLVNIHANPSTNIEPANTHVILNKVFDPWKCIKLKIVSPHPIDVNQFTKTINVNIKTNNKVGFSDGRYQKSAPRKPGCFNQKYSCNMPEDVRDETEEDTSCDSCCGKPGNNNCMPENIDEEADFDSCVTCGGNNKKSPPKKRGCLGDVSCDSCCGKNKIPPSNQQKQSCCLENDKSTDDILEIDLNEVEETLCNKKPQCEKVNCFDDILDVQEKASCHLCGGKNKKPVREDSINFGYLSSMLGEAFIMVLIISLLSLLIGLLKALLGLCSERVNRMCYGWVQHRGTYCYSSKYRRFMVNMFFFFMLPYMFCGKCFTPTQEDLMAAGRKCRGNCDQNLSHDTAYTDNETQTKRSRRISSGSNSSSNTSTSQSSCSSQEDSDTEEDYKIWEILKRMDLKTLSSGTETESFNSLDFVNILQSSFIVYRIFDQPLGNIIQIPRYFKYCMQGYFYYIDGKYKFSILELSMFQHKCIAEDHHTTEFLRPIVALNADSFDRDYRDHEEVFEANDLSIMVPFGVPCINVRTVNTAASVLNKEIEENHDGISDAAVSSDEENED